MCQRELNNKKLQLETKQLIGTCYLQAYDTARGFQTFREVVNYYRSKGNTQAEATAWKRMADWIPTDTSALMNIKFRYLEMARKLFQQANDTLNEIETIKEIADRRMNLGQLVVAEQGLLNQVVDLTRAEAIVGNGYPYAIEAADAAAVITTRDRDAFFAIFQRFIADQGFQLHVAQKAASKTRRR